MDKHNQDWGYVSFKEEQIGENTKFYISTKPNCFLVVLQWSACDWPQQLLGERGSASNGIQPVKELIIYLCIFSYLSIYLCTCLIFPLERGSQDQAFRVQGDLILPFPSAACLLVGENIEEELPRPSLRPFWLPFTSWWEYDGDILAASTTNEWIMYLCIFS